MLICSMNEISFVTKSIEVPVLNMDTSEFFTATERNNAVEDSCIHREELNALIYVDGVFESNE